MLRAGLTGQLGSGKSTVGSMLAARGAHVFSADEIGREQMQPGHAAYEGIVQHFGQEAMQPDGTLDRAALARLAFGGRLQELNAIVHPAVLGEQERLLGALFAREPHAIAVVESALIFEVERDARLRGESGGALRTWRSRFDAVVLVTAPLETRLQRFAARVAGGRALSEGEAAAVRADALRRIAAQIPDEEKLGEASFVLENSGDMAALEAAVDSLWQELLRLEAEGRG